MQDKHMALGINIPFCPNRCQYCPYPTTYATGLLMKSYCTSVLTEISQSCAQMDDYLVTSIHVGAGAASYVKAERICEMLNLIRKEFRLAEDCEISLRILPGFFNESKIPDYGAAGITIFEVDYHAGSFDRSYYTARQNYPAEEALTFKAFTHYKVDNIGYEVMYGLPGQTLAEWEQQLSDLCTLHPRHISIVEFRPAKTSKSARELANLYKVYGDRPEFHCAQGQELDDMRARARTILGASRFSEYVPGFFAQDGFRRRYVVDRAHNIDYMIFGAAGSACLDGYCTRNIADIKEYVDKGGDVALILDQAWEEVSDTTNEGSPALNRSPSKAYT